MIMFPINTGGGNVSNKTMLATYIAFNILILIALGFIYYLFLHDTYKGNFWDWSWDSEYFIETTNKLNTGLFSFIIWSAFFYVNGIALIFGLTMLVEKTILNKME